MRDGSGGEQWEPRATRTALVFLGKGAKQGEGDAEQDILRAGGRAGLLYKVEETLV